MRELSLNEVNVISGGAANDGYNFSFIVSNALTVGLISGVVVGNFYGGAAIGAIYATAMLTAKVADSYFFNTPQDPIIETHTIYVDPVTA